MGARYSVICIKCDEQFEVNEGGGFFFHLVHCNIDADRRGKWHSTNSVSSMSPISKDLAGPIRS